MAKRRNLKKEKAERNRAYARQFRSSSTRTNSRNRRFGGDQRKSSENEGAADT